MKKNCLSICWALNGIFKAPPLKWLFRVPALGTRDDPTSYAEWELQNVGKSLQCFKPYHIFDGNVILDVGSGMGGKSAYYALKGAKYVTAIDIDEERIQTAQAFAKKKNVGNVIFETRDASKLPYSSERFNMVTFNDSFEHIDRPEETLQECYRVLKKGGKAHIMFPPYGSPWGAHLFAHIRIPWAQLLFSENVLLRIWKEYFSKELRNNTYIYTQKKIDEILKAESISELMHLNKMTIKQFEEILKKTKFKVLLRRMYTFAGIQSNLFSRFSTLQEFMVIRIVTVLEK